MGRYELQLRRERTSRAGSFPRYGPAVGVGERHEVIDVEVARQRHRLSGIGVDPLAAVHDAAVPVAKAHRCFKGAGLRTGVPSTNDTPLTLPIVRAGLRFRWMLGVRAPLRLLDREQTMMALDGFLLFAPSAVAFERRLEARASALRRRLLLRAATIGAGTVAMIVGGRSSSTSTSS